MYRRVFLVHTFSIGNTGQGKVHWLNASGKRDEGRQPLHQEVKYSTVLYCTELYSNILYCSFLYFIVLYCTAIDVIVLFRTELFFIPLAASASGSKVPFLNFFKSFNRCYISIICKTGFLYQFHKHFGFSFTKDS